MSDSDCGAYRHGLARPLHVNTRAPPPWWDELLPGDNVLSALLEEKHSGKRRAQPGRGKKTAALEWLLKKTLREWGPQQKDRDDLGQQERSGKVERVRKRRRSTKSKEGSPGG